MKIETIQALFFLLSPPAQSPGSCFPSTGNGGKPNLTVFHACGVYKAARILNLDSIKIGFHLISGIINSWAAPPQRHWEVTELLWQEEGQGSLGMLQEGKLRQALNPVQKYRIFDTFPATGKGDFYFFSLSLAYNETQRQRQTLDSSPSCLQNPFSASNIYSHATNKHRFSGCFLFSPLC